MLNEVAKHRMFQIIEPWIPRAREILAHPEFQQWRQAVHPETMHRPAQLAEVHVFILEYLSWRIDQELIAANLIKPPENTK